MRTYLLLFAIAVPAMHAQTSVYLRSSAPQAQVIVGCTNATPVVCQTYAPHGLSLSCNTTTNICYCNPTAVAMGLGASTANGIRECVPTDSTHLALFDTLGSPIAGNGNWWTGYSTYPNISASAQWIGPLTKFTIPANPGPLGYLDGTNGDLMRRLSLSTVNGLAATNGVHVTACPACVITVNLTYNPTTVPYAVAAGQKFSVTGTGTSLDTCGDGSGSAGAQSPYTVASANGSSWTSNSFTCAGLTNGDYTNVNLHCGPAVTPNDTIGGTQSCTRVSQMAYTTNPLWTNLLTAMNNDHLSAPPDYKTLYDGGLMTPGNGIHAIYGMAAIRFLVDPTNSLWLSEILYSLNNDFRTSGTGYPINRGAWVGQSNAELNYTTDMEGLTLEYSVAAHASEGRYWTASEMSAFLNRMYNDQDDPNGTVCTQTNQDAANTSTHNWVLSSGKLAAGTNDATHAQLPNTDPHFNTANYYQNTVIQLATGGGGNDYAHYTYGLITAQSNSGLLTVAGGWTGGGNAPTLTNMVSATYTSGLTCSGSTGQTFGLSVGPGGGQLVFSLTGANTIASGTAATAILFGGGYASAPTTGSVMGSFGSASCTGTATIATTLGTSYTIFDTVTTNNLGSGSATITWTKTSNVSGSIYVGDGIYGYNGWGSNWYPSGMAIVTAVGTNTVTATNPGSSPYTTTTPKMAWRFPQWSTGDCGRLWATKAQGSTSQGVQAAVYGPGGAALVLEANGYPSDNIVNGGGSNPNAWPVFELATAADDARAVRDLGRTNGAMFDFGIRPLMDFSTGRLRDGPGYSTDEDSPVADLFIWGMTQSIPSYPKLDVTGPWGQNQAIWQMFGSIPDQENGQSWLIGWGGAGYALYGRDGLTGQGLVFSSTTDFAPLSTTTGYFRNWQEHSNVAGSIWGAVSDDRRGLGFLHNDPRIPSIDYTSLPTQFAFNVSSSDKVTSMTGWPSLYRGDAVISRTGWRSQSATVTLFDSATYSSPGGVYDSPRVGQVSIWATGCLLGADSNPCNGTWAQDSSTVSDSFQFGSGGYGSFRNGSPPNIGYTPLTMWASSSAGSAGTQFGDTQSRYAAACTSILPNYNQSYLNITLDHANVCWAHHKNLGHDQFIFQFHDVALANSSATSSLPMSWHLHYPQNGASQGGIGVYTTGTTTYLGSNQIRELEDGLGGGGSSGAPAHTHGLLTYVTSPFTITVHDDCVGIGGGQCNGASYPGGSGYSHRFTVAGGAAVGTNVSKFASVTCHKVMSTLSDTTLATFNLNPDANWTGAGCTGANSTGIAIFALNSLHNSMSSFPTTFSGAADWMIVGLAPGIYNVTVGGSTVIGSPFTVAAGDATIYFNTTGGGMVSVTKEGTCGSAGSTCVSGQVSTSGNVAIR